MKKKAYLTPDMEISYLEEMDIIVTSPGSTGEATGDNPGGGTPVVDEGEVTEPEDVPGTTPETQIAE